LSGGIVRQIAAGHTEHRPLQHNVAVAVPGNMRRTTPVGQVQSTTTANMITGRTIARARTVWPEPASHALIWSDAASPGNGSSRRTRLSLSTSTQHAQRIATA